MQKHVNIRVFGSVQNVGFRYATLQAANRIGVTGYVRNEPDRSVFIEAEGTEHNLTAFQLWCQKGPSWARVTRMEVQEAPVVGYERFEIK
jgi:acylphosphatase